MITISYLKGGRVFGGRVFEILKPGPLFFFLRNFLDFIIFRLRFLFLKPGPFSKKNFLLIFNRARHVLQK